MVATVSAFPNGVSSWGMPTMGMAGIPLSGNVFFVHSGRGGNSGDGGFDKPFSTLDYAVGRCTDSRGDVIVALPGHVETVIAAAGLDLDVIGITLIGLGRGSNRPTINFTTATTADMDVDAANITMQNFLFTGGVDALAEPFDVNAADFSLIGCEWRDVTGQATDVILTDNNADRMLIDGHYHNGAAAAGGASAIALVGSDNVVIRNFRINGNFSVGGIDIRTTAVTNLEIYNGYIWNKNASDIAVVDTITASTGRIGPDLFVMLTDNTTNITEAFTAATMHYFQPIAIVNLAGESSMFTNITASTDA
jgi:hypothetical protein